MSSPSKVAVEAAAGAIDRHTNRGAYVSKAAAKSALAAAAPHMLAEAWDEGAKAGAQSDGTHNPYRKVGK